MSSSWLYFFCRWQLESIFSDFWMLMLGTGDPKHGKGVTEPATNKHNWCDPIQFVGSGWRRSGYSVDVQGVGARWCRSARSPCAEKKDLCRPASTPCRCMGEDGLLGGVRRHGQGCSRWGRGDPVISFSISFALILAWLAGWGRGLLGVRSVFLCRWSTVSHCNLLSAHGWIMSVNLSLVSWAWSCGVVYSVEISSVYVRKFVFALLLVVEMEMEMRVAQYLLA
jgi:hypothetical protein